MPKAGAEEDKEFFLWIQGHEAMTRNLLIAAIALLLGFAQVFGAGYPDKPVKMVVPFTPAGATDLLARLVGEQLGKRLGQPVIIENRPGAGANVGAEIVAHSPNGGYTLLMGPASVYAISATLYPKLGYDLGRDLIPVALVANVPHVLLVNNDLPVKSVAELIALAKKQNGALNIASQGSGTVSHLEAELLKSMAGVEMTHIPYRGSAPALLDLMGGRVQVFFDSIASALPHIRAGKLRAIAVAAATRSPLLPDLPTVAEAIPGYSAHSWLGVFVPAGTPKPVIDRLQREVALVVEDPKSRAKLMEAGFEPKSSSAEAFAKLVREEIDKWRPIVRQSGAKPD
jgi:tripartite-type tricarboxylate transporter receptor subunit TctC